MDGVHVEPVERERVVGVEVVVQLDAVVAARSRVRRRETRIDAGARRRMDERRAFAESRGGQWGVDRLNGRGRSLAGLELVILVGDTAFENRPSRRLKRRAALDIRLLEPVIGACGLDALDPQTVEPDFPRVA